MITIEQLRALNKLENIAITEQAKQFTQEISIVDYSSAA